MPKKIYPPLPREGQREASDASSTSIPSRSSTSTPTLMPSRSSTSTPSLTPRGSSVARSSSTNSSRAEDPSTKDTIVTTNDNRRFVLTHRLSLEDLIQLAADVPELDLKTLFPDENNPFAWNPRKKQADKPYRPSPIVGTFSSIRLAREINEDGSLGSFFYVRTSKSADVIDKNIRARVIEWTLDELELQKKIQHLPFASTAIATAETTNKKGEQQIYQFAPIAEYGDLAHAAKTIFRSLEPSKKETLLGFLATSLLIAVAHLHENDVYHRDLKLENILIGHDFKLFITDFGSSLIAEDKKSTAAVDFDKLPPADGKYQPPFQLFGANLNLQQICEIHDYWSLGVTLIALFHSKEYATAYFAPLREQYKEQRKSGNNSTEQIDDERRLYNESVSDFLNQDILIPDPLKEIIGQLLLIDHPDNKPSLAGLIGNLAEELTMSAVELASIEALAKARSAATKKHNADSLAGLQQKNKPVNPEHVTPTSTSTKKDALIEYFSADGAPVQSTSNTTTPPISTPSPAEGLLTIDDKSADSYSSLASDDEFFDDPSDTESQRSATPPPGNAPLIHARHRFTEELREKNTARNSSKNDIEDYDTENDRLNDEAINKSTQPPKK